MLQKLRSGETTSILEQITAYSTRSMTFRAVYEAPVVVNESERPTGECMEDDTISFEDRNETPVSERVTHAGEKDQAEAKLVAVRDSADSDSTNESNESETPRLRKDTEEEPAPSSSIFSGDEEFITPDKSISISALEGLPSQAAVGSVSFVGNQLKDIGGPEKQAVDSIELDVPEAGSSAKDPSSRDLSSHRPRGSTSR